MAAEPESAWAVRRLATHGAEVTAAVAADFRDEPAAITAGDDGMVRVWDLRSGRLLLTHEAEPPPSQPQMSKAPARRASDAPMPQVLAITPTSDPDLLTGWGDGSVSQLSLATGVERHEPIVLQERSQVSAITPTPDGGYASGGVDGSVRLLHDGDVTTTLRATGMPVWSLVSVPTLDDGGLIFAGVGEGHVACWSTGPTPESLSPIKFGWSKRGRLLLAPLTDSYVFATDFDQIVELDTPVRHNWRFEVGFEITAITEVEVDRHPMLALGGEDGTVALVDPIGWQDSKRIEPPTSRVTRRATDPEPAPLYASPVGIGEPVSGIGSVELDGRTVLVVGGRRGGVYVVEPAVPGVSDQVELQDDVPATEAGADKLRRSPLAQALAVRMKRRHEDGHEASFLVHLDGRWGSGKTTVLNFVANELGDGWTIVRYNAWRQSRVGPPWWTLLTALRDEILKRRSWFGRVRLWFREMLEQRVRRASGLPATILLLLLAVGVFVLFRPSGDASQTVTTVQGIAAALTALATLWAGAQFVARFFGWHSPRGAKAFQDLDTNPMDRVASHFTWLVGREKRPIAYFIDDIDRCPAEDVVELLENVQTLVRDAGESQVDVLSPCFVVAGDGAWIRNAFEEHYADFADQIAEPGRPLGYLFLAKIFQLTLPVPRIGPDRQAQFFRELLGLDDDPVAAPQLVDEARRQVAAADNDEAQQAALAAFPRAVREEVAPAAVARQTEPAFAQATEHRLTGFAPLLPDNPRAVKRFLNAFAMTRSVRTVEGQAIPTPALALWTILQTRWPLLADALADHPDWILPNPIGVPAPILELLIHPEVQAVLAFQDGGPLTPDLVRSCSGG